MYELGKYYLCVTRYYNTLKNKTSLIRTPCCFLSCRNKESYIFDCDENL